MIQLGHTLHSRPNHAFILTRLPPPPPPVCSRASVSQQEQGIKNPRAKALWDKWRHVWMMAWERDRRLKDKFGYLQELEKVKNFDWEEWRKRFLKFHNNKKSRVTDLMRKASSI